MAAASSRPWYQWHWVTYLVTVALLWALVLAESQKNPWVGLSLNVGYYRESALGWPTAYLFESESGIPNRRPSDPLPKFEYRWNVSGLAIDSLVCTLLLTCTTFLVESWTRRERRFQFSLQQLLLWTATIGLLAGTVHINTLPPLSAHWYGTSLDLTRLMSLPLALGIVCAVYCSFWLTWQAIALRSRLAFPGPLAAPPPSR